MKDQVARKDIESLRHSLWQLEHGMRYYDSTFPTSGPESSVCVQRVIELLLEHLGLEIKYVPGNMRLVPAVEEAEK